jgi:hypothetical protein
MIPLAALYLLSIGICAERQGREGGQYGYDGKWWLSISGREQDGFVSGYYDCYTYEYKGPDRYTTKSFIEYRRLITEYYRNEPSKQTLPVPEAIHQLRDRPGEKPAAGETTSGRHGYFDGLYWKQISALGGTEKEVGFVEGYLACHAQLGHNRGGAFSKAPAEYAALITQWYGLQEDGDINEKREAVKVADVLFKFRDAAEE